MSKGERGKGKGKGERRRGKKVKGNLIIDFILLMLFLFF